MSKVFISFAIEDKFARDNLVFQAKQNNTPFDFTDMSIKEPFDNSWKTRCREIIRTCNGIIVFVSDHTYYADGARWEIKCGYDESIPVFPVYIHDEGAKKHPPELIGKRIYHWTWPNIKGFLESLK